MSGVASIRAEIRNEIDLINPLDEIELAAKTDVLAWIDSGVELCRLQKPAVPQLLSDKNNPQTEHKTLWAGNYSPEKRSLCNTIND